MNRKLKALGLALFAAFAMSAVAAQGASAHDFHSSSESGVTHLTAEADPSEPHQIFYDNEEEKGEKRGLQRSQRG